MKKSKKTIKKKEGKHFILSWAISAAIIGAVAVYFFIYGGVSNDKTAPEIGPTQITPNKIQTPTEVDYAQITANVPELDSLHEPVALLWHNAYPNRDYTLIRGTLPKLDASVFRLKQADLPGILHGKQGEWDAEIKTLESSLDELHKAADVDDGKSMIKGVESIHSSYEKLTRIIRPKLPELESFHQELYKVYHYYMPGYDLERIRVTIPLMNDKLGALKKASLPSNLRGKQNDFDMMVLKLDASLKELEKSVKTDNKEEIQSAVNQLHSNYQGMETILN
jgi:hypothetical protein